MKILITGGSGFLGIHLARYLLTKNCEVTLFDKSLLDDAGLKSKVKFVQGDIRNPKSVDISVKGQDFVVHAAAALPIAASQQLIFSTNINGTENVLKASYDHKVKRVIYISTTAVYKIDQPHPVNEQAIIEPIGHYGTSKIEAEKLCLAYQEKGLQVQIIRPKTFLGPERLGVFEILFEWIYEGRKVPMLGNGKNLYQLLDVSELCQAIWLTITTKHTNQTFNIGAKKFGTSGTDLNYVIRHAKSGARLFFVPAKPVQIILEVLEKLRLSPLAAWHYKTANLDSYVDISKAEKLLGFKSKISGADVLLEAYQWYVANRARLAGKVGVTHRVGWNQKILGLVKKLM